MNKQTVEQVEVWTDVQMDKQTDGLTDTLEKEQIYSQKNGQTDVNRWADEKTELLTG
jgi:hypothetical protein